VHHRRIMFSGKDIPGTSHIRRKLIYLVNPVHNSAHYVGLAKVADYKLVGWGLNKVVTFDIDSTNPIPFAFQTLYPMPSDKALRKPEPFCS